MSTPHYDPAQFFANLLKSSQDQMQKVMSGGGVDRDAGGRTWRCRFRGANRRRKPSSSPHMQQQYLANLSRMTGVPGGVPDMSAQMAAVTKQFTDLQQQYLSRALRS